MLKNESSKNLSGGNYISEMRKLKHNVLNKGSQNRREYTCYTYVITNHPDLETSFCIR